MLATKSNPYTFLKDGIWYFSRRVPADLRRHYRTGRIAYSLRTKSPIMLVVEQNLDNSVYDVYFMLRETYAAYSNADIHNPFIKEDIGNFSDLMKQ